MAKKKKSSAGKKPSNDALNLAALNWYALSINRLCLQIYATDPARFKNMSDVLTQTLESLKQVGKNLASPCGDCPDGWECCRNGLCAPTCDDMD